RVFFFQAEDGIRDFHVTGVQTCALPISPRDLTGRARVSRCRAPMTWFRRLGQRFEDARFRGAAALIVAVIAGLSIGFVLVPRARSEERRVGEGCGARRAAALGSKKSGRE